MCVILTDTHVILSHLSKIVLNFAEIQIRLNFARKALLTIERKLLHH